MENQVDISGIPKAALLYRLWSGQVPAAFFDKPWIQQPEFDWTTAEKIANAGYIDYFKGRAIKCDLSGDIVCPRLYDRDAGKDAFATAVAELRSK
jgi:hypothetical protein